ncbi:MAG: hypothetical protein IPG90_18630 [Bacteroidetes bacterium]|nr:hypothetical protein [Bacteroidota bacterium]
MKLTTIQTLTHYGIVLLLLFIVCLSGWSLIEIYVTNTYPGVRTADELIRSSLPFLLLAILFAFIQHRRLKFKEVNLTITEEQFQEAVERTAKELEWRIDKNNKAFLGIQTLELTGIGGEMVSIIKGKDHLLVNSICNPDSMSSVASYGWNRKNVKTFLKNLTDVLNNKPAEIKIEKVINEWSVKRVVIRILAYPFCICGHWTICFLFGGMFATIVAVDNFKNYNSPYFFAFTCSTLGLVIGLIVARKLNLYLKSQCNDRFS